MPPLRTIERLQRRDPRLTFHLDPRLGVVRRLRGDLERVELAPAADLTLQLHGAATRFIDAHAAAFGRVDVRALRPRETVADPRGGRSVIVQQYHGPCRVFGGGARFHFTREGVLDSVDNRLAPDLEGVPTAARVPLERAISTARRQQRGGALERPPELLVYGHVGRPRLVWEVRLRGDRPGPRGLPTREVTYVDASRGTVLLRYDDLQTVGPVIGKGAGFYSPAGPVNTWFDGGGYQLRDATRTASGGPEIITLRNSAFAPSVATDPDNVWDGAKTAPRSANQGAEVDVHRYAAAVADYFRVVHGRASYRIDGGVPAPLEAVVHYGSNLSQSFWDGYRVNVGDGDGARHGYCCTDDWLAHEFTHAYTENLCGLQYLGEAGALNEAISDVFAAFVTGNWLVFEGSWNDPAAPSERNMIDPTNGFRWDPARPIESVLAGCQPSHYDQRYLGAEDNGGVHINSGIINHLFYLLTVGGKHALSGVTVQGVGQSAAERLLWQCLTTNLVVLPQATFLDFRAAMLDACLTLFPTDLHLLTQVKNAFTAVGLGPDLYLRDSVDDTGVEPYAGDYVFASPDIISRATPAADPDTDFADPSDTTLSQSLAQGQDNHVYVRVHNRGSHADDAAVAVYVAPAAALAKPTAWTLVGTLSTAGIAPSSMKVLGPLKLPSALVSSPGPYSLVAVVSSALDPSPDPQHVTSLDDYVAFVRNSNNIATRNVDAMDLVPAATGVAELAVDTLDGTRERFDLRFDLRGFVPGARVRIAGPAHVLDGAVPRNLRLVERRDDWNIYEPLRGHDLLRPRLAPTPRGAGFDALSGFDGALVDGRVPLRVEYTLPEAEALASLARTSRARHRAGYVVSLQQRWKGQIVGSAAVRLRPPAEPQESATDAPRRRPSRARRHGG